MVLELVKFISRNPNLKKDFFFWGEGEKEGGEGLEEVIFLYRESKSKKRLLFFLWGGRGGEGGRWGRGG